MTESKTKIYVIAHDGGYEGHSLPVLAFEDKETAINFVKGSPESYSIVEVPIFPELPQVPWFLLEKINVEG